jgi:hypothetical protein
VEPALVPVDGAPVPAEPVSGWPVEPVVAVPEKPPDKPPEMPPLEMP